MRFGPRGGWVDAGAQGRLCCASVVLRSRRSCRRLRLMRGAMSRGAMLLFQMLLVSFRVAQRLRSVERSRTPHSHSKQSRKRSNCPRAGNPHSAGIPSTMDFMPCARPKGGPLLYRHNRSRRSFLPPSGLPCVRGLFAQRGHRVFLGSATALSARVCLLKHTIFWLSTESPSALRALLFLT